MFRVCNCSSVPDDHAALFRVKAAQAARRQYVYLNLLERFLNQRLELSGHLLVQAVADDHLSLRERAQSMASIAHPDFREDLLRYAADNFR